MNEERPDELLDRVLRESGLLRALREGRRAPHPAGRIWTSC